MNPCTDRLETSRTYASFASGALVAGTQLQRPTVNDPSNLQVTTGVVARGANQHHCQGPRVLEVGKKAGRRAGTQGCERVPLSSPGKGP